LKHALSVLNSAAEFVIKDEESWRDVRLQVKKYEL